MPYGTLNRQQNSHTLGGMSSRRIRTALVTALPLVSASGLAACGGGSSAAPETTLAPTTTPAPTTKVDPNLLCGVKSLVGSKEPMWWSTKSFGDVTVTAFVDEAGTPCGATAEWEAVAGLSKIINEDAIPQLNKFVESAKSSDIQGVSGATATAQAYVKSLQAALDSNR